VSAAGAGAHAGVRGTSTALPSLRREALVATALRGLLSVFKERLSVYEEPLLVDAQHRRPKNVQNEACASPRSSCSR
jgi:hypothetical protein